MKGHGAKCECKKEEAIVALLTQKNIEEAARSIGIGSATLLRWTAFLRLARSSTFGRSAQGCGGAGGVRGCRIARWSMMKRVSG